VSFLGTFAALLASFLCGFLICYICNLKWFALPIFAVIIFLQCIIDTILGSTVQVKFICDKCGKSIEKPVHCDSSAIYKSGVRFINNDVVNLISSFIIMLITLGLMLM
jgi:uncharacterized membrane protein